MGCIFCSICDKSVNSWTIYEDDDIQAFFDYNPASRGHVLIVPREHYTNIYDIPDSCLEKIIIFAKKLCLLYKELYGIEHVNIINSNGSYAGQEVFHYHMHVIPRGPDDGISFTWTGQSEMRADFEVLREEIVRGLSA